MNGGVFVTGTDTGIGKTVCACAIVRALAARGIDVAPMKPIAAGATEAEGVSANDDSRLLLEAAGRHDLPLEDVTPILLREAVAPHIAAANEGRPIELAPVLAALERLRQRSRFIVVEGVGGFMVPLASGLDTTALASAIGFPVVLVVGLRLGCLNHALLTARAIEACGLRLAGWIANAIDPHMAARRENVAALKERLHAPLLGTLAFTQPPDARAFARAIDVAPLIG